MTVVYVDDRLIETPAPCGGTVEEALRRVQAHHCAADRLVIGVRCDGLPVDVLNMEATLRRRAEDVQRLDLETGNRGEIVRDALANASLSLEETAETCSSAAELLNQGKVAEGIESLGDCARTWHQIHQAIEKSIGLLGPPARNLTIADKPLAQIMIEPRDALLQIKKALMSKDHVLLADILQYEFNDALNTWRSLVSRLLEIARS